MYLDSVSLLEVTGAFHRHLREGLLNAAQYRELHRVFRRHVHDEIWLLLPLTSSLIDRAGKIIQSLPHDVFLRAGDAIQLVSAQEAGESEIWSNDRHLLAAAPFFGLTPRTLSR